MMRPLCAVSLLFLATGCPGSNSAACPPTSTQAGDFTLTLRLQSGAGQCRVVSTADGGVADGDVATAPAPQNATMCVGRDPDSGVDLLYMAVENRTVRPSLLNPDGSFEFKTNSSGITGTVCGCALDVVETITGFIQPSTPGAFQIAPDGGQLTPPIASIQGTLVDGLDGSVGATGCLCNLPCTLAYQLIGTDR
ncbi:MAG: hypothetical protein ACJ79W_21780 [Myxococcales bacterium]